MNDLRGEWERNGRRATARDLAESANRQRADRRRRTAAERAARQAEADSRRVGAASRRAAREQQVRYMEWLTVAPKREGGRSRGRTRSTRFEAMTGQTFARAGHRGADGLSSFHFSWRGRGLRPRKGQKNNYPYRRGEAVRLVRYIMRDPAREIEGGGLVSNISLDPDDIATAFGAVEELEVAAGQANANVYVSIVVSLPHELTAAGRERVLASFCQAFKEEGLPYAGVLHRPDAGTDRRNYHAHVIASLRPIRKEADGRLSFAVLPSSDLNDREWIVPLRERIARAINEEMAAIEAETGTPQRIFTHLSNRERGLVPKTRAEGKLGPGAKDRERRAADAASMRVEAVLYRERVTVLDDLAEVVKGVAELVSHDVGALLASAREAVVARARSLAAPEEHERLRRRWRLFWITKNNAALMADDPREAEWLRSAGSLSEVTYLQRGRSLAGVPMLQSMGAPRGVTFGEHSREKLAPTLIDTPLATPEPAEVAGRSPSLLGRPQVEMSPSPVVVAAVREQEASTPVRSADSQEERAVRRALKKLAAIPFLPLKPDGGSSGGFTIHPAALQSAGNYEHVLRRAQSVENDQRVQALYAEKYSAMLKEVVAELTVKRVTRPKGAPVDQFVARPLLHLAFKSAGRDARLQAAVNNARAHWKVVEEEHQALQGLESMNEGKGL